MFGRLRRKREKQRKEREREARVDAQRQQELAQQQDPAKIGQNIQQIDQTVSGLMEQRQPEIDANRGRFEEQAYEEATKETPGMSDQRRRALQESANAQINSQVQNYSRMLASQSGQRGIRGGAAEAPQQALYQQGLQAQNQFQRDLVDKNEQQSMQRLAAYMASLQGKTAEDLLRRQQLQDLIYGGQDKARQDWENQYFKNRLGV